MKPALAGEAQYRVPPERSRWSALALAAAMHAGLFFFLWIGVRWQNTEPVAVEAEVWDMKTQAAAPPPAPLPLETAAPAPAPKALETPAPVVQATPKPAVVEAPAAPKPPDIALERRQAKLQAEKQAADLKRKEQREQEKFDKAADKAAALAQEKADAKAQAKAKAQTKALAEAKAKKELADAKEKEADKKLADKLAKTKRAAEDQKALDKVRAAEMRRITGTTGSGATGTAEKSTAPRIDSGYGAAIRSRIKNNIAYSGSTDVAGNPRAVFKIEQLPTGEIISVRKIKSSGIAAYDNAVENAIAKSSPLPKKKDGTVEREVEAVFDMKELP